MSSVGVIMVGIVVSGVGVVIFLRGGVVGVMFLWMIMFWK